MADRFPLILNTSANQIQEIASGDTLDLTGSNIKGVGIITAGNLSGNIIAGAGSSNIVSGVGTFADLRVGGDTSFSEDLVVTGNARVTGILTVGTSSIILNDSANTIKVGTALTLGHTQGLQFHTQNLHSAGFDVNQINVSGASTIGGNLDANGDLDVDGHTNLDNLSVAGVSTVTGAVTTGDHITLSGVNPRITFTDSNHNPDFELYGSAGNFKIWDATNSVGRLIVNSAGHVDIPGNLSVGGVLTYEDVTNIDSVGIVTAREGVFLPDLKQLKIGNTSAAPDLYLWHNSSTGNSNISNKTGDLFIQGNNGSGTVVNQIAVKSNASVELNYQGTKKVETTSYGVKTSGEVEIDSGHLRGDSTNGLRMFSDSTATHGITLTTSDHLVPSTDSTSDLGLTGTRWANVYADTLYGDGSNITALNGSAIASGTVPVARIGTGTKNNTTFYRGDGTFQVVSTDLVGDTSPQLGGNLDVNTKNIVFGDSSDGSSDDVLKFGAGTDMFMYHNGSHNYITGVTGNMYIRNQSSGSHIYFNSHANTEFYTNNGNNNSLKLLNASSVQLYWGGTGAKHFETVAAGLNFCGSNADQLQWQKSNNLLKFRDGTKAVFGEGDDLQIHGGEGGASAVINSANGDLFFRHGTEEQLILRDDGAVELYEDGTKRFETTSTGVKVSGDHNQIINSIVVSGNGTGAAGSVGHTASNNEGIFWHTDTTEYGIWREAGAWSGNYQQLNIHWQTGIVINGGSAHGLSGVRFASHTYPQTTNSYDLGSTTLKWRNIYTQDMHLSNEGTDGNDVDQTWGDWTIQEGSSDLFLLNNRNGKKYKFNLTEVN